MPNQKASLVQRHTFSSICPLLYDQPSSAAKRLLRCCSPYCTRPPQFIWRTIVLCATRHQQCLMEDNRKIWGVDADLCPQDRINTDPADNHPALYQPERGTEYDTILYVCCCHEKSPRPRPCLLDHLLNPLRPTPCNNSIAIFDRYITHVPPSSYLSFNSCQQRTD